jgi:hypothetical protein
MNAGSKSKEHLGKFLSKAEMSIDFTRELQTLPCERTI